MLFLSGLLGMMALGSVAIVGTGAFEGENLADGPADDPHGSASPDDDGAQDWFDAHAGTSDWPAQDDSAPDPGRSLFARMGLINMPPDAGGAATAPDPAPGPSADVLRLEDYRIEPEQKAEPDEADAPEMLDFDEDEDQLVIVYDDAGATGDPSLELRLAEGDPDTTEIVVDGAVLGRLPTTEAPELSQIVLVGESTAVALNLG